MVINVKDKRVFLNWLVNNVQFSRREILWILNYLINHEAILTNVHFVEKAAETDRGLVITASENNNQPMTLYLNHHQFHDSDQIFHEIRMNWKMNMYLECQFPNAWQTPQYLAVLEDNPFASWNESINNELTTQLEHFFEEEEQVSKKELLYQAIDAALETGNEAEFIRLTEELNQFKS